MKFYAIVFLALAALFAISLESGAQVFTTSMNTTCTGCVLRVANGVFTLAATPIPPNTCAPVITAAVAGALTSDTLVASFNADPTITPGFLPGAMLTLVPWVSVNAVSMKICNQGTVPLTPGTSANPIQVTWRIIR